MKLGQLELEVQTMQRVRGLLVLLPASAVDMTCLWELAVGERGEARGLAQFGCWRFFGRPGASERRRR